MRRSARFKAETPLRFKIWFYFIGLLMLIMVAGSATYMYYDHQDDLRYNCQPTGEQRLVNSMLHASDSALTTLVAQDKFLCDGGRVKWKTQYNNF